MMMIVYPNGAGSCRGTHLSVSIRLMTGENNHTLSFPINGIFKIQLLNWRETVDMLRRFCSLMSAYQKELRLQVTTGEEAA